MPTLTLENSSESRRVGPREPRAGARGCRCRSDRQGRSEIDEARTQVQSLRAPSASRQPGCPETTPGSVCSALRWETTPQPERPRQAARTPGARYRPADRGAPSRGVGLGAPLGRGLRSRWREPRCHRRSAAPSSRLRERRFWERASSLETYHQGVLPTTDRR